MQVVSFLCQSLNRWDCLSLRVSTADAQCVDYNCMDNGPVIPKQVMQYFSHSYMHISYLAMAVPLRMSTTSIKSEQDQSPFKSVLLFMSLRMNRVVVDLTLVHTLVSYCCRNAS